MPHVSFTLLSSKVAAARTTQTKAKMMLLRRTESLLLTVLVCFLVGSSLALETTVTNNSELETNLRRESGDKLARNAETAFEKKPDVELELIEEPIDVLPEAKAAHNGKDTTSTTRRERNLKMSKRYKSNNVFKYHYTPPYLKQTKYYHKGYYKPSYHKGYSKGYYKGYSKGYSNGYQKGL